MSDEAIGFSAFGAIVAALLMFFYFHQKKTLAQKEPRRTEESKRRNWHYESVSPKDAVFYISGKTDGILWKLQHKKVSSEVWKCTWFTSTTRYLQGHIKMGQRIEVGFETTFPGRLAIRYMMWHLNKELPEHATVAEQRYLF